MRRPFARLAFLLVCCVSVSLASCSSNNKGKIEGKWKLVSFPGMEDAEAAFKQMQLTMYFEFEPNGTFAMGFDSPNQMALDMIKAKAGTTRFTAKYKLLSGAGVELYDFSPGLLADAFKGQKTARSDIKIVGDDMTMTDPDGKVGKLVRMK